MMEIHTDLLLMQRKFLEERERSREMMICFGFEQEVLSEKVHIIKKNHQNMIKLIYVEKRYVLPNVNL